MSKRRPSNYWETEYEPDDFGHPLYVQRRKTIIQNNKILRKEVLSCITPSSPRDKRCSVANNLSVVDLKGCLSSDGVSAPTAPPTPLERDYQSQAEELHELMSRTYTRSNELFPRIGHSTRDVRIHNGIIEIKDRDINELIMNSEPYSVEEGSDVLDYLLPEASSLLPVPLAKVIHNSPLLLRRAVNHYNASPDKIYEILKKELLGEYNENEVG